MRIKIGDACEFINGGSWTESDYRECGLPVLKVSNFNSSGFTINDISFLNSELGNKYEKNKLKINDIIIATVGSHPSLVNSAAGRTIKVNSNVVNYYLNQNAICLRVNDEENINQIYLYYLTETTAFRNFIQQRGKGAANQMRIPISGIKDFSWDFPPLETQKKIASILSGYDDLIENNLKRIKILEEMAQQTYEEWFVRMRFPGHDASRASASVNAETGLPEGWEKGTLNAITGYLSGYAFKSAEFKDEGNGVIRIKNIGSNTIDLNDVAYIDDAYANKQSKFLLNAGDLLIAMTGATIGKVGIMPMSEKRYYLNQRVGKFVTDNTAFLNCFFNSTYGINQVVNIAGGAAQPNISAQQILDIELNVPEKSILKSFSENFNKNIQIIINLQSQNQRLREARDILLPRLMMGMIEV